MADVALPSFKKRSNKSTNIRKRPATPPPAADSSSDDQYSSEDENGTRIKRPRKEGVHVVTATTKSATDLSKSSHFTADRSATLATNDDATKTSHWSTETSAAAQRARTNNPPPSSDNPTTTSSDTAYKGAANYSTYITPSRESGGTVGPVKAAAANVRTITVTDFAPDVCKDYKQTGFCGFGDGCKFLHAREDYKQGWQLDKEWESVGKSSKPGAKKGNEVDEAVDELDGIPFKCIICKDDYKFPVQTKCGHYFCEKCAMGRYMREKKRTCAACSADTGGTFGVAKKLRELLLRKRKRMVEKEQEDGDGEEGAREGE